MKKYILFIIIAVLLSTLCSCTAATDYFGFTKEDFKVVDEKDSHGGFHGDGAYYLILNCSENKQKISYEPDYYCANSKHFLKNLQAQTIAEKEINIKQYDSYCNVESGNKNHGIEEKRSSPLKTEKTVHTPRASARAAFKALRRPRTLNRLVF